MRARLTRKWIAACAAIVGLGLLRYGLLHYGWFRLTGPPLGWGSDVALGLPVFSDRDPGEVEAYLPGYRAPSSSATASASPPPDSAGDGVVGKPFHRDSAPGCGLSVLQTHAGRVWGEEQHFYIQRHDGAGWREVLLPRAMKLQGATIVCPPSGAVVLLSRWNSWFPPDYERFLRSVFASELRAEFAVYALDLERGDLKYLFPGHGLVPSPDRRWVAYLTSLNGVSGFHNIKLYDVRTGRSARVLALAEADPGSGVSFGYDWSADSKALLITGRASGFTSLRIVYLVDTGELFDLEGRKR